MKGISLTDIFKVVLFGLKTNIQPYPKLSSNNLYLRLETGSTVPFVIKTKASFCIELTSFTYCRLMSNPLLMRRKLASVIRFANILSVKPEVCLRLSRVWTSV